MAVNPFFVDDNTPLAVGVNGEVSAVVRDGVVRVGDISPVLLTCAALSRDSRPAYVSVACLRLPIFAYDCTGECIRAPQACGG